VCPSLPASTAPDLGSRCLHWLIALPSRTNLRRGAKRKHIISVNYTFPAESPNMETSTPSPGCATRIMRFAKQWERCGPSVRRKPSNGRQIAGMSAWRVTCRLAPHESVHRAQRMGVIRFSPPGRHYSSQGAGLGTDSSADRGKATPKTPASGVDCSFSFHSSEEPETVRKPHTPPHLRGEILNEGKVVSVQPISQVECRD
jgi:hypothetical protein